MLLRPTCRSWLLLYNIGWLLSRRYYPSACQLDTLCKEANTEEFVLVDKLLVLSEGLFNYVAHNVTECGPIDEPEKALLLCQDGCWAWSRVQQCQLAESLTMANFSSSDAIDFNLQLSLLEDEERTGIVILFHQIWALLNPAQPKLVNKLILECFVSDQSWESEMVAQALGNEGNIHHILLPLNDLEVLIDDIVLGASLDGAQPLVFSFSLHQTTCTSSVMTISHLLPNLKSRRELRSRISLLYIM